MKKTILIIMICTMLVLAGCTKQCENGCGNPADSQCMADMCDKCCDYYMGLNGCYRSH